MSSDNKLNQDLRKLIDDLLRVRSQKHTSNDNIELNSERLKSLKNILRQNEHLLQPFFDHLLDDYLCRDSVTVRLYGVLLIDELFRRSHRFRECVIGNFEEFFKYTIETDPLRHPLPQPKNLAKNLKERTLKIVHNWYNTFGQAYRKLQLAYEYLKSCKTFDFQRIEAETIVERERSERERRRKEQIKERVIKKVTEDLQEIEDDMEKTLTEINSAFRLLVPELSVDDQPIIDSKRTDQEDSDSEDDDQPITPASVIRKSTDNSMETTDEPKSTAVIPKSSITDQISTLHAHGILNTKYDLSIAIKIDKPSITCDRDNIDLINNVRDCHKLISGRYLPKIRQLLNILGRYGGDEELTKRSIGWRMRLDEAKRKFDDLKLESTTLGKRSEPMEEEDDDFEVVPEKEGFEEIFRPPSPDVPSHIREWSKKSIGVSTVGSGRSIETTDIDRSIIADQPSQSTSEKDTDRSLIRTIPYGIDLEYWEHNKPIAPLINRNTADCHRFWRPNEGEETLGCSEKEAESYRTRVIEFAGQFEPIERECRAPVKDGKLCTRRDRYRCPFHGDIVDRDERGQRLDGTEEASTSNPGNSNTFGDEEMLRDIEKATGKQLIKKKKRMEHVDVNEEAIASRERLQKKVFNRSAVKRVASVQQAADNARQKKKFGGQWQYVFRDQ